MHNNVKSFNLREVFVIVGAFVAAALLFVAFSSWATTIGTNIDATGTMGAATSTPWGTLAVDQREAQGIIDPTFVVGDNGTTTPFIFVSSKGIVSFGSTTPSPLFLNPSDVVIGRNGSTNDLFVSGGLGVGNATTSDGDLVLGTGPTFAVLGNGRLIVGASTTAHTGGANVDRFVFDGGNMRVSSGGSATTTLSIDSGGGGSCIELRQAGTLYRAFVNAAGTGILVEAGACQ